MNDVRLLLTCGLPGADTTTRARELAESSNAVRLAKDEWLWSLGSSPSDREIGERLEGELWRLAKDLLRAGVNVVLDFGLWPCAERDELRTQARRLGVGVELHYLDAPVEHLWRRIEEHSPESSFHEETNTERPTLTLFCGPPGSGKSTLAKNLADARRQGARIELHLFSLTFEQLWARIENRNRCGPPEAVRIDRSTFEQIWDCFEVPDASELARFDDQVVHRAGG